MSKLALALALSFLGISVVFGGCTPMGPWETEDEEDVVEDSDELKGQFCGGIAGIACPDGQVCVDDHSDNCNPNTGGADCGGVCRNGKPAKTHCHTKGRDYVSTSPNECAATLFFCAEGTQSFFDECGCGCETIPSQCSPDCGSGEYCAECKTIDGSGFFCMPNGSAC